MNNFKNKKGNKKGSNQQYKNVTKPKYTKIKVAIANSDFYKSSLDSLYNLLCSISFDKVAIPVYMSKSELFDNDQLKGTAIFGVISKFNNDNTFTVSVQENLADKFIENEHVMSIRCKKDYENSEITYVTSFCIVKGEPIINEYEDIEEAMYNASLDSSTDETESIPVDVILEEVPGEDYPKAEISK